TVQAQIWMPSPYQHVQHRDVIIPPPKLADSPTRLGNWPFVRSRGHLLKLLLLMWDQQSGPTQISWTTSIEQRCFPNIQKGSWHVSNTISEMHVRRDSPKANPSKGPPSSS